MNRVPIEDVHLDNEHGLRVRPIAGDFEYIYRDASGIRWDRSHRSLIAYEPDRWVPIEVFQQMLFAARNEYGVTLFTTRETRYSGISDDLRSAIESSSASFENLYEELKSASPIAPHLPP